MKRSPRKGATDRSFVVALSRGLDVLRAFQPNDGLLGNQEIAARTKLPKPTVDLSMGKLGKDPATGRRIIKTIVKYDVKKPGGTVRVDLLKWVAADGQV